MSGMVTGSAETRERGIPPNGEGRMYENGHLMRYAQSVITSTLSAIAAIAAMDHSACFFGCAWLCPDQGDSRRPQPFESRVIYWRYRSTMTLTPKHLAFGIAPSEQLQSCRVSSMWAVCKSHMPP